MRSRIRLLVSAPLVVCFVLMWSARSHDDIAAAQKRTPISVTRIFTGPDGQTHVEEVDVKLMPGGTSGELSEMIACPCSSPSRSRRACNRHDSPHALALRRHFTEYFVNAPPAWTSEFGPSAA